MCERVTVARINRGRRESQFCRACFFDGEEFCAREGVSYKSRRLKRWPMSDMKAKQPLAAPEPKKKRQSLALDSATEKVRLCRVFFTCYVC